MNSAEIAKPNRAISLQAAAGLLLCAIGFYLTRLEPYEVRTRIASAGGCNLPTDVYEPRSGSPVGTVVLFHGLSANKKVMAFTAQEFANQDLRVFVPDLPGHGKAPGPFSPDRAEACAASLVRDLAALKAIIPERTVLAGHSMGGAIATRVAAKIPVAGVIAISPAPMHPSPSVASELLLFPSPPPLAPHSLILSAEWEPVAIRRIAQDLVTASIDTSSKHQVIPRTSHVSILFDPATFESIRTWTGQLLGTNPSAPFPKNRPALGCLLGIFGLTLLAPPFLREFSPDLSLASLKVPPPRVPILRGLATIAILSIFSATALRFLPAIPLVHLFQGDYLAALLFLVGVGSLAIHRKSLPAFKSLFTPGIAGSTIAAIILIALFGAWFALTFHEAGLTPARWLRLPLLVFLFLPWHLSEEILLGAATRSPDLPRVLRAIVSRAILWLTAVAAIFYLHSGQFIFVLLPVYFAMFSVLQRLAMDVIRLRTPSLPAAAIFGAILLAGFVLAILPIA